MMDLVTGATGHIGNTLVRTLLSRGGNVRVLVRPGKPIPALAGLPVEIAYGDVLEPDSLNGAMEGIGIVYHLAARISFEAGPDPQTMRVNLEGTRNVLATAQRHGVRRLVFASSIYSLRTPVEGPIDESCPFDIASGHGTYDRSKAAASLAVQQAVQEGLDAVIVCPTAVTGPFDFQRSEAGHGILYNMAPGLKFTVDGAYDFVDVRDVAQGMILAAQHGRRGETYILGGERLTVQDVAQIIWDASGVWHIGIHLPGWVADLAADVLPFFTDDPLVTPYSLAAIRANSNISHRKATVELGYAPRPASTAIMDAVRWWQERSGEPLPAPRPVTPAAAQ